MDCRLWGGILFEPKDLATNDLIIGRYPKTDDGDGVWIGVSDEFQEGR